MHLINVAKAILHTKLQEDCKCISVWFENLIKINRIASRMSEWIYNLFVCIDFFLIKNRSLLRTSNKTLPNVIPRKAYTLKKYSTQYM